MRIITLIPSATEIVCRLGLEKALVGVSHECDYPANVRGLPILSRPKMNPKASSAQIDRDVRQLVADGLSVYEIDTERLESLKPDLIITQDQCEVCAVSLEDVEKAVCELSSTKTKICSLKPDCLNDVYSDIERVGKFTQHIEQASHLVKQMQNDFKRIAEKSTRKQRIALIEWLEPPMIAGGWMPEIAKVAGAIPVIVDEPKRFETVTWDTIADSDADIFVLLPCGFPIAQTLSELNHSPTQEALLTALRGRDCFIVDGNAYFNRPGPRLVESCEILHHIVNNIPTPNAVSFPIGGLLSTP